MLHVKLSLLSNRYLDVNKQTGSARRIPQQQLEFMGNNLSVINFSDKKITKLSTGIQVFIQIEYLRLLRNFIFSF